MAASPYPGVLSPNGSASQATGPPSLNIPRQAYALTRYDAHSGVSTAMTSSRWARGDATFAM